MFQLRKWTQKEKVFNNFFFLLNYLLCYRNVDVYIYIYYALIKFENPVNSFQIFPNIFQVGMDACDQKKNSKSCN